MAVPVQMTNDSSSVSKMSAVARNYWTDPFLRYFIRKTSRRAPLINRGYYIRLKAVEYAVSRFISEVSSSPAWQIVSYGAGFDTTFFRLASEDRLANGVFYEIDLPNVVKRKSEIIMDSPELRILVGHCDKPDRKMNGCTCIITSKYRLVSIDLNDVESLQSQLQDVGIDVLQPTLFLSECVLTYLDQSRYDVRF
ncbi:tRNA wybutosine-synthesizing protein 4-like [Corticium candelabrum]|uniref:tRNA wybutosine-synthesizing protein 4-like n=1 Tax=Corticium candelabrum TaxID=121492 RepID=UPI002E256199|nr:tRNA wybutosine-synthesizing protein 4-like [Corticium candelabrum]